MSEDQNNILENNMKYLNMMFEVSTIANQTDDVFVLLKNISDYVNNITKAKNITFYLLEDQYYKCVCTNEKTRSNEIFEYEEASSPFWDAVSQAQLIKMKDGAGLQVFRSFLEQNNILSLDPSHVRVFFDNLAPICFCFINEDTDCPINI